MSAVLAGWLARLRATLVESTRSALKRCGVAVHRHRDDWNYVPDLYGRSHHKQVDVRTEQPFAELARTALADGRPCLHHDRLYTLFQAVRQVARRTPCDGALTIVEVGVYRGGTTRFLARTALAVGRPDARVHGFDTFEGHAAVDIRPDRDTAHRAGGMGDVSFEDVRAYLQDLPAVTLHRGRFQDTGTVLSGRVDVVHLDVDIYEPIAFALPFFHAHLPAGGILVVDDYGFTTCPGARQAVDEFLAGPHGTAYASMHLLTGQALLVKLSGGGEPGAGAAK